MCVAINKEIKGIIDYRDLHLPDGRDAETAANRFFMDYYEKLTNNHFDMWNKQQVMVKNDNPEWLPAFWVKDFENRKNIGFDLFRHFTSGNTFLSTDEDFLIFISRMLSMSICTEYVLIFMSRDEAYYVLERQKNKIVNTNIKISLAYYREMTDSFCLLPLDQSRYSEDSKSKDPFSLSRKPWH